MKIAVVFTGGTIGSRQSGGWISPESDAKYTLIEGFKSEKIKDVEFSFFSPFTILSENLSAKEINRLISLIKEISSKDFDGIIVTHGTDTLAFTACALSYAFGSECLPIVLVSSNFPLDDARANGHQNFALAVEQIASEKQKGVFVSYKNRGEDAKIFNPHSLLSYLEGDDRLFALKNAEIKNLSPINFTLCENPKILVLNTHPGDHFGYSLRGVNAIILRPYHSGTLNTASEEFKRFCRKANAKKVPLFAVNYPEGATYESSALFGELGIVPLKNSTFTSTFLKLWIGISLKADLQNFISE